ncbi:hypothetical protein ACE01N_12730 [Saccharicrinis sp. FJH2]|uniref:hypothetical protein n=1 Tax=Saccharicrinis sp. FJH65 TaxID=3344659 RepID=UPI0035F37FF6
MNKQSRALRIKHRTFVILLVSLNLILYTNILSAQKTSFSIGTDFPYQHYAGFNYQIQNFEFSLKTGILVPPYSDIIINELDNIGIKGIYIDILNSAYDFGWMNTIGVHYNFGREKNWYAGPEFRYDKLTASDTPANLIESVTGLKFNSFIPFTFTETNAKLGMNMYGMGLRTGRKLFFGEANNHCIKIELSAYKYISTQSVLTINEKTADKINARLNTLLWDEVFKSYGYVGGLGISYTYTF